MLHCGSWTTRGTNSINLVEYWRKSICEAIFELEFVASARQLDASLRQYELGALRLSNVSIDSDHEVIRSRAAVSRSERPYFNLNYIREGHWTIDHYGRVIELQPGELVLLDNREPYNVRSSAAGHIAVHMPLEWLRLWIPSPEAFVAQPIRLGAPWRAALAAILEDAPLLDDSAPGCADLCSEQIGGALALALGPLHTRNTSHIRLMLLRIKSAMREMSHDQELDAGTVADRVGISTRYLHKLLDRENMHYGSELIRIRIERAKVMLRDARFNELSIAEIGWRSGFSDPSHFSKRFRSACDQTPGRFRLETQDG